jgi:pimeloyl-ACP methyl ester carboxylesterase
VRCLADNDGVQPFRSVGRFAAGWLALACHAATAEPSRIELKPCSADGIEATCGTYEVFEDRAAARGRRIPLRVVVLAAVGPEKQPDPLFVLAGGPGQGASDNTEFIARTFAEVRKQRDIVLLDQRGTGGSNALDCNVYGTTAQGHLRDLYPPDAVQACAEEWQKHADTRFYTTDIAMADLDEVRAAMGYERLNLFGTSYGTRAAQVYMRQFPDRVRAVILKGVTPMEHAFFLPMARDAQRALDLTFQDCAADAACREAYPELRENWAGVLRRLGDGDVEAEVEEPESKKKVAVQIGRPGIAPTIRSLLQSVQGAAQLPKLINSAAAGDFGPLATATLTIRRSFSQVLSPGMFLAVAAAEDLRLTDAEELARASRETFLGDYYFQQVRRVSTLIPLGEMPSDYRESVRSDTPTLLISGFLDPATPPDGGDEVARHLPNSRHVVVRNAAHSYGGLSPCMDNIMAEFIGRGTAEGIDTSCTAAIRRPPFVLPDKPKP